MPVLPHRHEEIDSVEANGFHDAWESRQSRWRFLRGSGPLALARRFLIVYAILLALATAAIGVWVGQQTEDGILHRTAADTALYVHSFVAPGVQSLAIQPELEPAAVATLQREFTGTALGQRVVSFKLWSRDGRILYSPAQSLVGQQFPLAGDRADAFNGDVTVDMSTLANPENVYERQRWSRLVEMYIPILHNNSGDVLAVAEFYQLPDEIDALTGRATIGTWAIVLFVAIVSYLLVAGMVIWASRTIARQQKKLRDQVSQLSKLFGQVSDLNGRIRSAGAHAVAIQAQESRRISADLHDGPGQALALALLKFEDVRSSVDESGEMPGNGALTAAYEGISGALTEIRQIAAGLRLPEVAPLTLTGTIERAVRDHERRTGTPIALELDALPAQAPLAVKIGLFRALQETLSNATRHGHGIGVAVHAWTEGGVLYLEVSDHGPGFTVTEQFREGGLGLPGIRERTALVGGTFEIRSTPGHGTAVHISWPLSEASDLREELAPAGSAA
jgi:signal transduction histidine kinase